MALTPSQAEIEARGLVDVLHSAFRASPAHNAEFENPAKRAMLVAALRAKILTGWSPKRGFSKTYDAPARREAPAQRTPPAAMSAEEARRILAHAVERFRAWKSEQRNAAV